MPGELAPHEDKEFRPRRVKTCRRACLALLQFLDADVAVPNGFPFVLKADVAFGGPVFHGRLAEVEVENLFAIDFTPMIFEFEGNSVFWFQHYLESPMVTLFMGVVYIGSFLLIMVFTIVLFAYMNMKRVTSRMVFLYLVLFFLTIPFYLLVVVYTPSYPKMFFPGASSMVGGMEPLLYNYGPRVHDFFVNYDTFNNCFPSMHIGYPAATIMLLFWDIRGFKRFRGYKTFLIVMLILIAVSILYLGIHWFTDIMGGFLIAVIGVLITDRYALGFWRWVHRFDCHLKKWTHKKS